MILRLQKTTLAKRVVFLRGKEATTVNEIKLIALDMDGTLLTTDKRLTEENRSALERAAAAGIEIVPATGRYYDAIPEPVRKLPFLHYAITINGAQIYDIRNQRVLSRAELPCETAIRIMEYFDTLPVIYDCYQDNRGWITEGLQAKAARFARTKPVLDMLEKFRIPVPELKAHIREQGRSVQKVMAFFRDETVRQQARDYLAKYFPETAVSSSVENNLEINASQANKGNALKLLADLLGIPMAQTMAFGDDLNDATMLRAAGIGVAMGNATPAALAAADVQTASCDESGVAAAIRSLLGI